MDKDEFHNTYGKLVAKAWSDDDFKAKLLSDTMSVFKENDILVPRGTEVRMVENTDKLTHFILPPETSGEQLQDASRGWFASVHFIVTERYSIEFALLSLICVSVLLLMLEVRILSQ